MSNQSSKPPRPPAPATTPGSGTPGAQPGRLVSHEVDGVADAIPTEAEGDALFDKLFGGELIDEDTHDQLDPQTPEAAPARPAPPPRPAPPAPPPRPAPPQRPELESTELPTDRPPPPPPAEPTLGEMVARSAVDTGGGEHVAGPPPAALEAEDRADMEGSPRPEPYAEPYALPEVRPDEPPADSAEDTRPILLDEQPATGPGSVNFADAVRPARSHPLGAADRVASQEAAAAAAQVDEPSGAAAPPLPPVPGRPAAAPPPPRPGTPPRPPAPPPRPAPPPVAARGAASSEAPPHGTSEPPRLTSEPPPLPTELAAPEVEHELAGLDDDALVVSGDVELLAEEVDGAELDALGSGGADAVVALMQQGERDRWVERADWLFREAPSADEPTARAEALLVVSELFATAGELERAEVIAREAVQLAPASPWAYRQLRGVLMARDSWAEVGDTLAAEVRAAPTPQAKVHATLFAAEVARLVQGDAPAWARQQEQAAHAAADDPRAALALLMQRLASVDEVGDVELTGGAAPALAKAWGVLRQLRSDSAATDEAQGPLGGLLVARAAVRKRDPQRAVAALAVVEQSDELAGGAAWLISALAAARGDLRAESVAALGRAQHGTHAALATRTRALRAVEAGEQALAIDLAAEAESGVLSAVERLVIAALAAGTPEAMTEWLADCADDEDRAPIAAAVSAALSEPTAAGRDVVGIGDDALAAAAALGRALASGSAATSSPGDEQGEQAHAEAESDEGASEDELAVEALAGAVVRPEGEASPLAAPGSEPAPASAPPPPPRRGPPPSGPHSGSLEHLGLGMVLRDRATELLEADPSHGAARAVLLEHCYQTKQASRVAEALLESAELAGGLGRERGLASALLAELAGDPEQMVVDVERVLAVAPDSEAALRMSLPAVDAVTAANALMRLGEAVGEPVRAALAYTEAGLRLMEVEGEEEAGEQMLRRATETLPDLPIASFLGAYVAQALGDVEAQAFWLEQRRAASVAAADAVPDLVRQAARLSDSDPSAAAALLEEAHRARPDDYTLRELYEQAAGGVEDRAEWLMGRLSTAEQGDGSLALEAALACELAGDLEGAAQCAGRAIQAGDDGLGPVFALRLAGHGYGADEVLQTLSSRARQARDPAARGGWQWLLAGVAHAGKGDAEQAVRALGDVLEQAPGDLLALHDLAALLAAGDDNAALAATSISLAQALDGVNAAAYAILAARLFLALGERERFDDAVLLARAANPSDIWVMRQALDSARVRGDHHDAAGIAQILAEQAEHPLDRACLLLRASESLAAAGADDDAASLVGDALETWPRHPVALLERASLLERLVGAGEAADAYEALALSCQAPNERAAKLYHAATLWLSADDPVGQAEGRRLLEAVVGVNPSHQDAFGRLQAIYLAAGAKRELAQLLAARLEGVADPDERVQLEVLRGRTLAEAGSPDEARFALSAALEANPDNAEALAAFADVCAIEGDWETVEQTLVRLGRLVTEPSEQCHIYLELGELYDLHRPNLERAEQAYRQVLKLDPDNAAARDKLVDLALRNDDMAGALALQQQLIDAASAPADKCARTVRFAEIHELSGDTKLAEQTLVKARRTWSREPAAMVALYQFYRRNDQQPAADMLLDRAAAEVRRGLGAGRFEAALFGMVKAVAELRQSPHAAEMAQATLAAIEGQPAYVSGAGGLAGQPELDEYLAPEVFTPSFRALLQATGSVLDAAAPFDLRSLRAKPLTPSYAAIAERALEIAGSYGLPELQVLASNAIGAVCMPVQAEPAVVCFGLSLVTADRADIRDFLIHRAMKVIQARICALLRTAPIDLWPLLAAYLKLHSPSFTPQGVSAAKVESFLSAMQQAGAAPRNPQINLLASEVIGSIGNRASSLNSAAGSWGSRAGLLALGDPNVAIDAIAWAHGTTQGLPASGTDRMRWIGRQAEARDMVVFSVSEAYATARAALGLEPVESIDALPAG